MHRVSKKSNSRRHQSHIIDPIGHDQGLGILLSKKGKIQEMAQQVKALTIKADNLSLIPRNHMVEEKD